MSYREHCVAINHVSCHLKFLRNTIICASCKKVPNGLSHFHAKRRTGVHGLHPFFFQHGTKLSDYDSSDVIDYILLQTMSCQKKGCIAMHVHPPIGMWIAQAVRRPFIIMQPLCGYKLTSQVLQEHIVQHKYSLFS